MRRRGFTHTGGTWANPNPANRMIVYVEERRIMSSVGVFGRSGVEEQVRTLLSKKKSKKVLRCNEFLFRVII